jgi:hypothetical protein
MFKAALSSKPEVPSSLTVFVVFVVVTERVYDENTMVAEHLVIAGSVFGAR